jgi:hypothetical protein
VAATVVLFAAVMALYVAKHGGDPASLACVGRNRAREAGYEAVRTTVGPSGYDGQFYYVLAQHPWAQQSEGAIDAPAARHLRFLYPALCWLFSGGHARLLFWVMPLVNLAALAGLAGLGAWTALCYGLNAWWGFLLPLAVNAGLPALHNLTDPLATLALVGLFAAWLAGSRGWVLALWAAAAVLSREQNVGVVGILLIAGAWNGRRDVAAGLTGVILLWLGWVVLLRTAYGVWPFLQGEGNFGPPLAGVYYRLTHPGGNLAFSTRLAIIFLLSMVHLGVQVGLASYVATRKVDGAIALCMLAGIGLAVVGNTLIYGDFWSYTRVFVWLPLGIWFGSLQAGLRWPLVAMAPALLWPLAAALKYV